MSSVPYPVPITGFELASDYRDFWGEQIPVALEHLYPLLESGCYQPRYYRAPDNAQETIATDPGYLQYSLHIPAGSYIWGICQGGATNLFNFNVTDTALGHRWFSQPVPNTYIQRLNRLAWLLPKPYPVVSPGIFLCEFFLTASPSAVCAITFGVLEEVQKTSGGG